MLLEIMSEYDKKSIGIRLIITYVENNNKINIWSFKIY